MQNLLTLNKEAYMMYLKKDKEETNQTDYEL
jgi:hypothetical protein